ncbi:MAG TPA: glycoside hydrolase family 2 protein [Rhizobacter sp.]|nr:glycoside hydrolase family 2 protein [Rhizobacter sp.]
MQGQVRRIDGHHREALLTGWSLCATAPGSLDVASPPAEAVWTPLAALTCAAAALRVLGQWSLDDAPRRFDAQDWWYRLHFDAPTLVEHERLFLGFDGLATIAQVWLNGTPLLSSDNMFIAHECEVGPKLRPHGNELTLCFRSLDNHLAKRRARPRWRAPMIENQQLRWVRTTLLGRTPGWSPPAALVGPWKDIWLEKRSHVDFSELRLQTRLDAGSGIADICVKACPWHGAVIEQIELILQREALRHAQTLSPSDDADTFSGALVVDRPDLWWPHTHGRPALYEASLQLRLKGRADSIMVDLGRVGFRDIHIDTREGDFSLQVNGIPVFCRGACWTPLDAVTLRASPSATVAAIAQACAAGMNMLRVSGTMVYEDNAFFDACDEQGMLVWQDWMFANMDYPQGDAAFMTSVTTEVKQQLSRVQARPSVAVLCGNSEVEQQAAMWGTSRELWRPPLFDEYLAQLCRQQAPQQSYWPSSAHGGAFPHQANVGTASYYGVGAYLRPLEDARRSELRFATECLAFANVPQPTAVARLPGGHATRVHHPAWKSRSPRDLGAGWDFDDVRDHYLAKLFDTDPQKLRYSDHERYLTLSRVTSGEVMAAAFAEWRRPASACRGALVLFLRDLWPAAGWGLIDDLGAPKACWHYLKRTLQPVQVSITDEGVNGLFVHVVNERGDAQPVELDVTVWRGGEVAVATGRQAMTLAAHSGRTLAALELFEHFSDLSNAYRFGPLMHDAVVATLRDAASRQLTQAFYFPAGLNLHRDADIGLSANVRQLDATTAEMTLSTRRLAQAVHFDIPGFSADDEYFHLVPGQEQRVMLRSSTSQTPVGTVHAINTHAATRLEAPA